MLYAEKKEARKNNNIVTGRLLERARFSHRFEASKVALQLRDKPDLDIISPAKQAFPWGFVALFASCSRGNWDENEKNGGRAGERRGEKYGFL